MFKKKPITHLIALALMSITDAYAADYNAITHLIILNNVKISGNPNLSTTLTPTDGAGIHAGQVWSLSTGNATGAQDAQYTSDGKLYIPNLVQDAFITYNASFLLTNVAPLEFTVLDITTTSFSNGAETKVVFNQGVKGDAGLQGSQGAQGLKGDTGSQGLKGDTGAIGLKGAAGYQGIDGTTGLQGLTGAVGAVGANGANGLTTSVNGVTQVSGAISLTKANFTDLNSLDNTSDANKPVSTATQTALNLKAPLADPDFTGTPTAATAAAGTSNTQLATTAFVKAAIDLGMQ